MDTPGDLPGQLERAWLGGNGLTCRAPGSTEAKRAHHSVELAPSGLEGVLSTQFKGLGVVQYGQRPPWDLRRRFPPSNLGTSGADTGSGLMSPGSVSFSIVSLLKPHCMQVIKLPYRSFSSCRSPEQRGHRLNQNIQGYSLIAHMPPKIPGPFADGGNFIWV